MHQLGETRSASARNHALFTPETFVRAPLPGMRGAAAIVHASPAMGAAFTQYTAEFEPGGQLGPAAAERFVYVLEGELAVTVGRKRHTLLPGGYVYLPEGRESVSAAAPAPHQLPPALGATVGSAPQEPPPPPAVAAARLLHEPPPPPAATAARPPGEPSPLAIAAARPPGELPPPAVIAARSPFDAPPRAAAARAVVIEKIYQPLPGTRPPAPLIGTEDSVPGEPLNGDPWLTVRKLLPDHPSFDFAVNTMQYLPGATLPMVEIHVMEHGLLMLEGGGIYRLDDRWYPVTAGDFIWMGPYCPQWFGALGKTPAKYLIYKDWNRHPLVTK